jgi:hypothetical protein
VTRAVLLDRDEVVRCREACAAWLLAERGETGQVDPGAFAMRLLIQEALEPRQAEVARVIVWLDTRVLQTGATAAEDKASGVTTAIIALTEKPGWHLVETPLPTAEEEALMSDEHQLRTQIASMLRPVQNQMATISERLTEFYAVARRRAELTFERTKVVRVLESSEADAPKRLAREGDFDCSELDEIMASHANATAWLESLLAPLQWRNTEAEDRLGLLSLPVPRTVDEWRSSRRNLEARLAAAGFSTRQIGQLLPDGKGDVRRRVAMRRRRLMRSTGDTTVDK